MGKLPGDSPSRREGASQMEMEGSGYLLGEAVMRKTTVGVGELRNKMNTSIWE